MIFFFRSEKAGACLLPNTCLGIAAKLFAQFETQRVGISWKDVSGFPSPDENFNLAWVFYMLLAQSAIYAAVTWWVLCNLNWKCTHMHTTTKLPPNFESPHATLSSFHLSITGSLISYITSTHGCWMWTVEETVPRVQGKVTLYSRRSHKQAKQYDGQKRNLCIYFHKVPNVTKQREGRLVSLVSPCPQQNQFQNYYE